MPNLSLNYSLKQRFYELNPHDRIVKDYLEKAEAKDVLLKAFDSDRLNEGINETRLFSFINQRLTPSKPDLIKYFEESVEEDVALLFIDIDSFSKTIKGYSNRLLKSYLDSYYGDIIRIICNNGGEIEKLMGDGIICVFGKPFLNLASPKYVYKAEECAEAVIKKFHNTDKNVKVAIHKGVIKYYKVPGEYYGEYTIIGQPLTDLYRLESVSIKNSLNFYVGSLYDKLGWINSIFEEDKILGRDLKIGELQGVDYNEIRVIQFPGFN